MEYKVSIYRNDSSELYSIIDEIMEDRKLVEKLIRSETVINSFRQPSNGCLTLYTRDKDSALMIQLQYV